MSGNIIREDLTLIGSHILNADESDTIEEKKPVIENFVETIKKLLSQEEAMKENALIKDFRSGETIKYGEIIPNCMR